MINLFPHYTVDIIQNSILPSYLSFSESEDGSIEFTSVTYASFESVTTVNYSDQSLGNTYNLPNTIAYSEAGEVNNNKKLSKWQKEIENEFNENSRPIYVRTFSIASEEHVSDNIEIIDHIDVVSIFINKNNTNVPTVKQAKDEDEEILQILLAA